jgi:hypothetical protein
MQATLNNWRKKYSSVGASELSELKAMKQENSRLKHVYAELAHDHRLQKTSSKKTVRSAAVKPFQKWLIASEISLEAGFSIELVLEQKCFFTTKPAGRVYLLSIA